MIRKNQINCNLIREKRSSKSIFDSFIKAFRPEEEVCPICRRRGDCRIHAYYNRYIIDFIAGKPVAVLIRIPRVICSCGHTHAILPDPIIPYDSYSLFFILRVLIEYFRKTCTILKLCEKFGVTPSMLYRWKNLYRRHRFEWQGILRSLEQDILSSLDEFIRISPFSDLAFSFFRKTGYSFLQSHKNPAPCQRSGSDP